MKRRDFLKTASQGACVVALTAACGEVPATTDAGTDAGTGTEEPIISNRPASGTFFVPPQFEGTLVDGVRSFALEMQHSSYAFTGEALTATMAFNGAFLGPTLRVKKGERVEMNVTNSLNEVTSCHWHGMRIPATEDGSPHQVIEPGTTWTAAYDIIQKASTNWFHPHVHESTGSQVYAGLAGMLIVDDEESEALDLPKTYGTDDFPVVIQDRELDAEGVFMYTLSGRDQMVGKMGNTLMVNGVIDPVLEVQAKEIRLRLLNGSNARIYDLRLSDGMQMKLIATEQEFLESPVMLDRLVMSPGERYEVVVDLSERPNAPLFLTDASTGLNLITLDVAEKAPLQTRTPDELTIWKPLDPLRAVRTRPFDLQMNMSGVAINGEVMDLNVINQEMKINEIEIWELTNRSMMNHNFHVHGMHFQVLSRNGAAPALWEQGFKDTVFLPPNSNIKVIIQFTDYEVDADAPYMYHCHILEHEDQGMMGQLIVTS